MKHIKLGFLVPAINYVMEPDMYRLAPPGVSVHFTRLKTPEITTENENSRETLEQGFEMMIEDTLDAASRLATIDPDVISYGSTSGSFYRGVDYEQALIKKMQDATGVPAITPSTATVAALQELGLRNICLITPYADWVTEKGKSFLQENGFHVPVSRGLGLGPLETGKQTSGVARDLALDAFTEDCDGIFCSCTFFRAIEVIEEIENSLGVPVVTANQCTMWLLLRTAGYGRPVRGYGELMQRF